MRRDGGNSTHFLIIRKRNIWAWRTDNPNRIVSPQQISIYAHAIWRRKSPVSEAIVRKIEQMLPDGQISDAQRSIAESRFAKRHPVLVSEFTFAFGGMRAWPDLLTARCRRERPKAAIYNSRPIGLYIRL
jgi:hypothetical protein